MKSIDDVVKDEILKMIIANSKIEHEQIAPFDIEHLKKNVDNQRVNVDKCVQYITYLIGKRLLMEIEKKWNHHCEYCRHDCFNGDDIRKVFKDVLNIEGE